MLLQQNIIGNIGKDARNEVINEKDYTIFDVAVSQMIKGQSVTLWVNCMMPGINEKLLPHLKAGVLVYVTGQAKISAYMAEDKGSNTKYPAPSVSLHVDKVQLIAGKKEKPQG